MFQQGLSGLNGASKSLSVIGNNIANASTVGFKASQAQFADLYANSLNGISGQQAGIGVSVARVAQQFNQGGLESSNNPLDVAINGSGFFRLVTNNGQVEYTRNGQFKMNDDGTIVNGTNGATLTGFLSNKDGVILKGSPVPIKIDYSDLTPIATTKANFALNLSSTEKQPKTTPFSALDPTSYNRSQLNEVYDSLGTKHNYTTYYVKTGENNWDVYAASDGTETIAATVAAAITTSPEVAQARKEYNDALKATPPVQADIDALAINYATVAGGVMRQAAEDAGATPEQLARLELAYDATTGVGTKSGIKPDEIDLRLQEAVAVPAVKVGSLIFNAKGELDAAAMLGMDPPQTLPLTVNLPIFPSTGSEQPLVIQTSFDGMTQYGSVSSDKPHKADGRAAAALTRFEVDKDGNIVGHYSSGLSRTLAQVALVNFVSPEGLTPLGNNVWGESPASGSPIIGVANEGGMGTMVPNMVESSTTDLTEELVNMITAQRVYQANAQTIKTEDSILQTLVNLR